MDPKNMAFEGTAERAEKGFTARKTPVAASTKMDSLVRCKKMEGRDAVQLLG